MNHSDFSPPADGRGRPAAPDSWAGTLVICALLLGLAVAWGARETHGRRVAVENMSAARDAEMVVSGRQDEVGRLLADPRTRLARLAGSTPSRVRSATVAWNGVRKAGVLFCDQLAPLEAARTYHLWWDEEGTTRRDVAPIAFAPGQSVYSFRCDWVPGGRGKFVFGVGSTSAAGGATGADETLLVEADDGR